MSLEGPNSENSLTVNVSIKNGVRVFSPQPTLSTKLSWNADHRRLDIADPGRYFLIFAAQGFNFASPAIEFKGLHPGISVYQGDSNESATQVTILIATDAAAGERAEFWLVAQGGGTEDPTILVEPPGSVVDAKVPVPSLWVDVSLGADGLYLYAPDQADTPNLIWLDDERSAKITEKGTFRVIFNAAFKLGPFGVLFPDGRPTNVKKSKVEDIVTLEIEAIANQVIPLVIEKADNGFVPNEPTILVEPPGGKE